METVYAGEGEQFVQAEQDLEWFYLTGDSAMGLHAQSYDGGGGRVFDERASESAHEALCTWRHRGDVARHARIGRRIALLSSHHQGVAAARFVPRPWDEHFREALTPRKGHATLAGVALLTRAARALLEADDLKRQRAMSGGPSMPLLPRTSEQVSIGELHAFLVRQSAKASRRRIFAPVRAEATKLVTEVLASYEHIRRHGGSVVAAERVAAA